MTFTNHAPTRGADADAPPVDVTSVDGGVAPQHQCAHLMLARLLRDTADFSEAVLASMRSAGLGWGFGLGLFWLLDDNGQLELVEARTELGVSAPRTVEVSWGLRLGLNEGAPGRAFSTGGPVQVSRTDVRRGDYFYPRAEVGRAEGFRRAVATPVRRGGRRDGEIVGVIEFFDSTPGTMPDYMLDDIDVLVSQLGAWIGDSALRQELRHESAVEIQEELVENLWLAQAALDVGQVDQATKLVDESIGIARRIGDAVAARGGQLDDD